MHAGSSSPPLERPQVVVVAGPNGAGKSTVAPDLLQTGLGVSVFVNADTIAAGLSVFAPQAAAFQAGRIMLARLKDLARQRQSFAFETTLASRTFAPWLRGLIADGYLLHVEFLWLSSPDLAVSRVADRVRLGGHDVPEPTIRRRYAAGLKNFWHTYRLLATTCRVYDNSAPGETRLLAYADAGSPGTVLCELAWAAFRRGVSDDP